MYLQVNRRQFKGDNCQKPFSEELDFVAKKRTYTKRLAANILEQLKEGDILNVSRRNDVTEEEIEQLFIQRNAILERKCEALASKAKTKWFHEGERLNKYFLKLLRRKDAMIEKETLETDTGMTKNWTDIKKKITVLYKISMKMELKQNHKIHFMTILQR